MVGEEGFDIEELKLKLQQGLRLKEFHSYGFLDRTLMKDSHSMAEIGGRARRKVSE